MEKDIEKAIETLHNGGVILYPTDTIWGIGCDATNAEAVKKVYEIKQRADSKSLIILVNGVNRVYSYTDSVPDVALDIMELATKPTTVIFDSAKNLPELLISDDGSIAMRVPDDEFCQKLLTRFKRPIVSSSANISGEKSPDSFSQISDNLIDNVDFVVKYKQNESSKRKSSSIIKVKGDGQISIIRN